MNTIGNNLYLKLNLESLKLQTIMYGKIIDHSNTFAQEFYTYN